ncbi:uncharacterized protein K02A2.6-like [Octopus sinensis]|uniref:Uncharacterized protein K02A2.6-like n=1 Tax=Octopus sinensis TaxID=2607531 RepID=A0A6P7T1I8_9MOLL|nr:uncharacterized protein K02A2.6-like [Octopus sinensis]
MKMEYLPSKKMRLADGLSRLIPKYNEPLENTVTAELKAENEIKYVLCNAVRELPVTLEEIKFKAETDEFSLKRKNIVISEETNNTIRVAGRNTISNLHSICENMFMCAQRVVMPTPLQGQMFKEFNTGNLGISRMKSLMRGYVYWPKLYLDIEKLIKSCRGCALAAKSPSIKFQPWSKTDIPWCRLHIDFAGPLNRAYYLIEDKANKYSIDYPYFAEKSVGGQPRETCFSKIVVVYPVQKELLPIRKHHRDVDYYKDSELDVELQKCLLDNFFA